MHPLKISMVITFILVAIVLFAGISNMGKSSQPGNEKAARRSTALMMARVMLSFALLAQIAIYFMFIKN